MTTLKGPWRGYKEDAAKVKSKMESMGTTAQGLQTGALGDMAGPSEGQTVPMEANWHQVAAAQRPDEPMMAEHSWTPAAIGGKGGQSLHRDSWGNHQTRRSQTHGLGPI